MFGFIFLLFKHTISPVNSIHTGLHMSQLRKIYLYLRTLCGNETSKNGSIDTLFVLLNGLLSAKQINGSGDDNKREDSMSLDLERPI